MLPTGHSNLACGENNRLTGVSSTKSHMVIKVCASSRVRRFVIRDDPPNVTAAKIGSRVAVVNPLSHRQSRIIAPAKPMMAAILRFGPTRSPKKRPPQTSQRTAGHDMPRQGKARQGKARHHAAGKGLRKGLYAQNGKGDADQMHHRMASFHRGQAMTPDEGCRKGGDNRILPKSGRLRLETHLVGDRPRHRIGQCKADAHQHKKASTLQIFC
jgi:hypothetical protein